MPQTFPRQRHRLRCRGNAWSGYRGSRRRDRSPCARHARKVRRAMLVCTVVESGLLGEIDREANAAVLRRRRVRELADRGEYGSDGLVVVLILVLDLIELAGERGVGGEQFAQPHEGAQDVEAHFDGAGTVEDGGGHDGAVFGEAVGRESRIAVPLGTGRILRPVQRFRLAPGEAEYEIFRKSFGVALDLLVETFGGDPIERGELRVQQYAMAAQGEDGMGDVVCVHSRLLGTGRI